MEHLDEMACLLYHEGQLDRERARALTVHTADCAQCRTLLRALERESRLLTRAMLEEDEAVPARLLPAPGRARNSLGWAWAVSFGLAASGAYALYTSYIEPWQQQLDQAGFGGTNLMGLLLFEGAFWKGWQSMLILLEIVAMLTLGTIGLIFLRRRFKRWTALAVVMTALAVALVLPAPASAAEVRKGQDITVAKGEVIQNDLIATGDRATIAGTVEGDVIFVGRVLEVEGHVTGDVISFSRDLGVKGQVDGNLRAFANNITVSGTIGKNVTSFSDPVTLEESGKIGGSLTVFSGMLALDGRVGRDVLVFSGRSVLNGKINGSLHLRGGKLTIGPTLEIAGKAVYDQEGGEAPDIQPGAKLASPLEVKLVEHRPDYAKPGYYYWKVIWAATAFLFGLILMFLMPSFAHESVQAAGRYGASLGLGLLVLFGVPIAAGIACITVVGIGVGITTFALWLLAIYVTQIVVGAWLGEKLLGPATGTGALVGRMALGLVIIRAVAIAPHIGGWIHFAVVLWGMGALSLAIYRRLQPASATPGSPASAPLPA